MSPSQGNPLYPKPRQVFTLEQIENLPLDDIESLNIEIEGSDYTVQNSHVNSENMFNNCPELKDSLWAYEYTTNEWIPVFRYVGPLEDLPKLFDWEPEIDPFYKNRKSFWVTPKGSPRQQYY